MMTLKDIETATADELAAELAAAGEYTEDWERCTREELAARVRRLLATYAPLTPPEFRED